jgi:hypothetical protein
MRTLRFGPGVKSKAVEALRYAVPVVTTPVGAQWLKGPNEIAPVVESAQDISGSALHFPADDDAWRKRSMDQTVLAKCRFFPRNTVPPDDRGC